MIETVKPSGNGSHIFIPNSWLGQPIEVITKEETLIRYPKKIGTGAHVYLPKRLENQNVRIKKCDIKKAVLDIVYPYMCFLKGIYLVGSWARGEQRIGSDIDIMVFTNDCSSMDFKKEGQILFYSMKKLENPEKDNLPFLSNLLNDAIPIFNRDLLMNVKKEFFHKLKDKKFKFNKQALKINKDTIHTLKIMKIFFEGYDKSDDKEKYIEEFKYPLKVKTLKERAEQDSFKFILSDLFFAIKDLLMLYEYINDRKFSIKDSNSFFKVKHFKNYYNLFKENRFKLYLHVPIKDIRKLYLKCLEMKKEIVKTREMFNGQP